MGCCNLIHAKESVAVTALLLVLFLILLNGVFAMSEIAVVSSRAVRLQQAATDGKRGAQAALNLSQEPTRFLSTVQVGITLIGIVSGAIGEAAIADKLQPLFESVPAIAPFARVVSFTIMVATVTYMSLIFGELVPKRVAMHNPEGIARIVAGPMTLLALVAAPAVKLLSVSTDAVLFLIGAKKSEEPSITEDELHVLFEQGTQAGVLNLSEHDMLKNVLRFDEMRVENLMTPRVDMDYLDLADTDDEIRAQLLGSPHTRIPLCRDGVDNVIGVLQAKDMLTASLSGVKPDLESLARPALFLPRSLRATRALEQLKQARANLAIVVDEHGQVNGIVTINDVLEAIVGDIPTAEDDEEPEFVQRSDGSWLVAGQVDIHPLRAKFGFGPLPGEEDGNFHTLGGFVLASLGRIPKESDTVAWDGVVFEVMDMDGNRVDKVLITLPPSDEPARPEEAADSE